MMQSVPMRVFLVVTVSAIAIAPILAAYGKPLTLDAMLRNEQLGEVIVTPDGCLVFYERLGALEEMPGYYGRRMLNGGPRTEIAIFSLRTGKRERTNRIEVRENEGVTIESLSPDGRYLVYQRYTLARPYLEVLDLHTNNIVQISDIPDNLFMGTLKWISNSEFLYPAVSTPDRRQGYLNHEQGPNGLQENWRLMRSGEAVTASAIGSGAYTNISVQAGGNYLVVIDAASGGSRVISEGKFLVWIPSPDGDRVAAVRLGPPSYVKDAPLQYGTQDVYSKELVIYELRRDVKEHTVCAECEVLPTSPAWSGNGDQLAFFARKKGQGWHTDGLFVFDTGAHRAIPIDTGGLELDIGVEGIALKPKYAWLGDDLAIRAVPRPQSGRTKQGIETIERSDELGRKQRSAQRSSEWYVHAGESEWKSITDSLPQGARTAVAVVREKLLLRSEDELWLVAVNDAPVLLTGDVGEDFTLWWDDNAPYETHPRRLAGLEQALTLIVPEGHGGDRRLMALRLSDGDLTPLPGLAPEDSLLRLTPDGGAIVKRVEQSNLIKLEQIEAGGERHTISSLNRHLEGVQRAINVPIETKSASGEPLVSWLSLPATYKEGERLSVVVTAYLGLTYSKQRKSTALGDMVSVQAAHLNGELFTAEGYAFLQVSLPSDYSDGSREQFDGLGEAVVNVVKEAARQGYIDPTRAALYGHSYGGPTVMGVISQTDFFKAAIVTAGPYDPWSWYGTIQPPRRMSSGYDGLQLYAATQLETNIGGIGVPPWENPEKYLRSSPIAHVRSINTPVMIVHGDWDQVPISQAEQMFSALKRLEKDAIFVRYWGEHHVLHSPANMKDFQTRTQQFLAEYLGR